MGFRQLSVRGKDKAAAEWTFTCAVHNLLKALTAGRLTPQALAWPGRGPAGTPPPAPQPDQPPEHGNQFRDSPYMGQRVTTTESGWWGWGKRGG